MADIENVSRRMEEKGPRCRSAGEGKTAKLLRGEDEGPRSVKGDG